MSTPRSNRIAIVVHGGAGALSNQGIPTAKKGCRDAIAAGYKVLLCQGTALEAVEQAVRVLETNPNFNAGTGSVLTRNGTVEMDALIMDGKTLKAGALSSVNCVGHPISLAKYIMMYTPHVMLSNNDVLRTFIQSLQTKYPNITEELQLLNNDCSSLITEARKKQLAITIEELNKTTSNSNDIWGMMTANIPMPSSSSVSFSNSTLLGETATIATETTKTQDLTQAIQQATQALIKDNKSITDDHPCNGDHDTVGAVAIDMYGNIAAATSTGGMTCKWQGRVGDTPIIGAGCYAHNNLGGISTTGTGEYIMRAMLAKEVANVYHEYGGIQNEEKYNNTNDNIPYSQYQSTSYATRIVHEALSRMRYNVGGPGAGCIYISPKGTIGIGHYSARMSWAYATGNISDTISTSSSNTSTPKQKITFSIITGVQQSELLNDSSIAPVLNLPSSWKLFSESSYTDSCLPVKCRTENISVTQSIDVCEPHVNEEIITIDV